MPRSAVSFLEELVKRYSPSGHEAELSEFIVGEMEDIGLKTHIDQAGNVIGEFGEADPTILLCGHMDTVPGELPVKLEGKKLYGRGTVDAKAPLAAMIVAASILLKQKFSGKLIVAGVVDEEGKGYGIRQLIKDHVKGDYAIFGEPSGIEQITIAYKGSLHLKVSIKTTTGHSSAPWLFENAIEKSFNIYQLLKAINFPFEKKESKFYSLTSSLIKITGGSLSSQIPSRCTFHVDFRIPPNINSIQLLDIVKQKTKEYQKINPKINVFLEKLYSCEPYEVDTNSLLIRSLSWAIRMVRSKPATWVRKTGSGDMNLFGASEKIPIVTYGVGNSRLDHTNNEWVDLKDYEESIQVLTKGIKKLSELHKKRK